MLALLQAKQCVSLCWNVTILRLYFKCVFNEIEQVYSLVILVGDFSSS